MPMISLGTEICINMELDVSLPENPQGSEIIAADFEASETQNICRLSEKGRSVFLQTSLLPGENRADRRNFCHYSGISRSGMPGMMSLHSDLQP